MLRTHCHLNVGRPYRTSGSDVNIAHFGFRRRQWKVKHTNKKKKQCVNAFNTARISEQYTSSDTMLENVFVQIMMAKNTNKLE